MPTDLSWDNPEKTILIATFTGDITRDEFIATFDREAEYFASVDHPVYLIGDFRQLGKMSVDILGLTSMITRQIPTNMAGAVLVGSNPILETVFRIWSKLYGKMAMVKTMEEAYARVGRSA